MGAKKTALCEKAFWDFFSKSYAPYDMQTYDIWVEIYKFLSRSNILIDSSPFDQEQLNQIRQRNEYLWLLCKSSADGRLSLEFRNQGFVISEEIKQDPKLIVLSENNKEKECNQFGLININSSNIWSKKNLFRDSGVAIRKGEESGWEKILQEQIQDIASNSMIIVDNYIFDNSEDDQEDNLECILKALLPQESKLPYHISVFYIVKNENRQRIETNQKRLEEKIKEIRPNLDVVCEFFETNTTDFHDRTIITNNIWLSSGVGFSIFKSRGHIERKFSSKKSTTLSIAYPYLGGENIGSLDKGYEDLIKNAKKAIEIRGKQSANILLQ